MKTDPFDTLSDALELEILQAPDRELLADPEHRALAGQARETIAAAMAARRLHRGPMRPSPARRGERHDVVRQLLVASPRARRLAAISGPEGLSDADVEAIFTQFAAAGLVPPDDA